MPAMHIVSTASEMLVGVYTRQGLYNAELVLATSVAGEEIGTTQMSDVSLEPKLLPPGKLKLHPTPPTPGNQGRWDSIS